jgi:glutamyl-tRNA synthetase
MHLGNLYTALAAWLCAKSRGGTFLLRMEDLDPMRCPRSFADLILSDLEWLGLSWDNATVPYQSEPGSHLYMVLRPSAAGGTAVSVLL